MESDTVDRAPVLVSACLVGVRCRYDGRCTPDVHLAEKTGGRSVLPVCPEQLGGLPTPRPAAEIRGGTGADVLDGRASVRVRASNEDVTAPYRRGAEETARLARQFHVRLAILKSRSPSCGCGEIYRDGRLADGDGVTAALLKRMGICVISDDAPGQGDPEGLSDRPRG